MSAEIPATVKPLIDHYTSLIEADLPGLLEGLYLHGAVALAAYDESQSDVDFVAVIAHIPTALEIRSLMHIHRLLAQSYPRPSLEGSYLQWHDLGRFPEDIQPFPYFHDRTLHPSGYFEANAVTWWLLKTQGIAVLGPEPASLDFVVDWDTLIRNMKINLHTYWAEWISSPRRFAGLLTDYGVQWAVLGILRLLYSFREGAITSKIDAGQYALTNLPAKWHKIIHEAIEIRQGVKSSYYRLRIERALKARAFLKYVVLCCNKEL